MNKSLGCSAMIGDVFLMTSYDHPFGTPQHRFCQLWGQHCRLHMVAPRLLPKTSPGGKLSLPFWMHVSQLGSDPFENFLKCAAAVVDIDPSPCPMGVLYLLVANKQATDHY